MHLRPKIEFMKVPLKKKIYMKNTDTILVIDDDVDCNLFLKKTLSHHGFVFS